MPKKIRQLISDLKEAGFTLDRQRGSHRQFKHGNFRGIITLSGGDGDDARRYQEKQIIEAIAFSKRPR